MCAGQRPLTHCHVSIFVQIEVFEELGCSRPKKDYKGALTGTYDDNLCIKIKGKAIAADIRAAEKVFASVRN